MQAPAQVQTSVQSQVRFNRVPEKVPVKVSEALVQSQVRFNRVPEKVPEKVWEALVQGDLPTVIRKTQSESQHMTQKHLLSPFLLSHLCSRQEHAK